ncbi:hypothetical protein, partial [Levilactobacillus fujinensis]
KPVLWLEAFPTASGIPGIRSAAVFTNLAVIIPTVASVTQTFWLSTFSYDQKVTCKICLSRKRENFFVFVRRK